MSDFCQDIDLLALEPGIFLSGSFAGQNLLAGKDGAIDGTAFSSASSDLQAAGVEGGMVLCTYATTPSEGLAVEIVSVDSATELTVSVLRPDPQATPTPPPPGTGLLFHIRSFKPQIRSISASLAEKLRASAEVAGVRAADFADSCQLRTTTAHGVLAAIFVARAENASDSDANWIKAQHYRAEFARLQPQLRLAVDADGDGSAEQTRALGNVTLRRV
jgi:hypothetical protein